MIIKEGIKQKVSCPQDVANICRAILQAEHEVDRNKEHFWVLGLNTNNTIVYIEMVCLGILSQSIVHPREVFRLAIMKGVHRIMAAHNHPSENCNPSSEDELITKKLEAAGEIIGISLLDHIIITERGHFSFKNAGLL